MFENIFESKKDQQPDRITRAIYICFGIGAAWNLISCAGLAALAILFGLAMILR